MMKMLIYYAAQPILYEIGLAVGHSNYQRHSAYLLEYSDIAGFSQVGQAMMA